MSAQGATIRRGTAHLPIWPVAGLVAIAAAVFVITSAFDGVERGGRDAAPSIEAAAVNPGMWTLSQAEAYLSELDSVGVANPGMWTLSQAEAYLEGLQVSTQPTGLENPGAYVPDVTGRAGAPCPQCR
jgi:hypothetical protein